VSIGGRNAATDGGQIACADQFPNSFAMTSIDVPAKIAVR
jgi:hypothetical protein